MHSTDPTKRCPPTNTIHKKTLKVLLCEQSQVNTLTSSSSLSSTSMVKLGEEKKRIKRGQSGTRTRDLSHPKRESCL